MSAISVRIGSIAQCSVFLAGALELLARMLKETPAACGAAAAAHDCMHAVADLAAHGGFSVRMPPATEASAHLVLSKT
jgi:hypothetical protein